MSLLVVVQNVTKDLTTEVCDYRYQVLVGDGTVERSRTLAIGEVKGHLRADGWQVLVERVLAAEVAKGHTGVYESGRSDGSTPR